MKIISRENLEFDRQIFSKLLLLVTFYVDPEIFTEMIAENRYFNGSNQMTLVALKY